MSSSALVGWVLLFAPAVDAGPEAVWPAVVERVDGGAPQSSDAGLLEAVDGPHEWSADGGPDDTAADARTAESAAAGEAGPELGAGRDGGWADAPVDGAAEVTTAVDAGALESGLWVTAEEVAPVTPSESEVRARPFGTLNARAAVDLRFHSSPPAGPPEQVAEGRAGARVGVDLSLRPELRVLLEGRFRWVAATQAGLTRPEAVFEPMLGEAFVDLYWPWLDLRVGHQVLTQGAQPIGAPQDVLAPRELRDDPLLLPAEEARLPVFAVRATGEWSWLRWTATYVPFFSPDRFAVFGDDQALLQPSAGGGLPLEVDPSIEDRLQDRLLETSRPVDSGALGDLALGVRVPVGPVTAGISWTWFNEKLPQVTLDPELELALDAARRGREIPPAVLLSLQNRFSAGETLMTGVYRRQHLFALEAQALIDTVQVDADVAFTPARTLVDDRLRPLRLPALSWGATAAPAEDAALSWLVSYQGLSVFQVPADRLLFLLEPALSRGAERTAFLHIVSAGARYRLLDEDLTAGVQGALELVQRSYALTAELSWRWREGARVFAAVSLLGGPGRSPFGYFGRNDAAALGVEFELF